MWHQQQDGLHYPSYSAWQCHRDFDLICSLFGYCDREEAHLGHARCIQRLEQSVDMK